MSVMEEVAEATIPVYGWNDGTAAHSAGYLNATVAALLDATGARDVLDAGCGNGALCGYLAAKGYSVIGVDADVAGIPVARAAYPGVRFEVVRFAEDPATLKLERDGLVDAVISTEVVEHLYSPHELAHFAFAALRPGGTLIISTPYHGYLKNLALALAGAMDKHYTASWHGGHIKFWSRATLTELLREAGFHVTGFVGSGRLPWLWKSMVLTARKPG